LSTTLIVGAVTLLIAIAVGNAVGSRVIGQVTGRISALVPTPFPIVRNAPRDSTETPAPKEEQVMSVATDPGFADPRVTPEPEALQAAPPAAPPAPAAALTPSPNGHRQAAPSRVETAPPLTVPLASPSAFSDDQVQTTESESSAVPRAIGTGRAAPAALSSSPADPSSVEKP
jgi:hypothetical protein